MAVIEDEFLSSLFHRAADSFEVPETGVEDILRRSIGFEAIQVDGLADDESGLPVAEPDSTVRRFRSVVGQHRLLTAAAAVVVVAAIGTSATLLSGSNTPHSPARSAIAGSTVTSTTTLHALRGALHRWHQLLGLPPPDQPPKNQLPPDLPVAPQLRSRVRESRHWEPPRPQRLLLPLQRRMGLSPPSRPASNKPGR